MTCLLIVVIPYKTLPNSVQTCGVNCGDSGDDLVSEPALVDPLMSKAPPCYFANILTFYS